MTEDPKDKEEPKAKEPTQEWGPARPDSSREGTSRREGPELDRLPPPAFPPGSRRSALRPLTLGKPTKGASDFPEGAYISPDEPIRKPSDALAGALISPDEPIRYRVPHLASDSAGENEEVGEEYGVATGMSDEGPVYGTDHIFQSSDGAVRTAADRLEALARRLRKRGTAALLIGPEVSGFDAMLRGFVAGYLAGKGDDRESPL